MPVVVLHRERSEKLAQRFAEELREQDGAYLGWHEGFTEREREQWVAAFDALIQDGLIGEREPGQ